MQYKRRSSVVSLAVLVVLAAGAIGWIDFGKPYQDLADRFPRGDGTLRGEGLVGGRIELPAGDIRLDKPLLIGSGVELVGKGWGATRLYYDGEGAAVRFTSYAKHGVHVGGVVRDLAIYSKVGDGIAIDQQTVGEHFAVRNVVLNVGGTAINFRRADHQLIFFPTIQDVIVTYAGNRAADVYAMGTLIERLNVSNPGRPINKGVRPTAMLCIEGSGTVRDSRFEGMWGAPLIWAKGHLTFTSNHIEPYTDVQPQVIFQGWDQPQAHAASFIIDRPSFVQPSHQIVLRGQMTLNVLSPDFGNELENGSPTAPLDQCFKIEGTNAKLLNNGKQVLPPP